MPPKIKFAHIASTAFAMLPDEGYIRQKDLIPAVLPISHATLWRWVKRGMFPAPRRFTHGVTAWHVGQVRAFLAKQA